MEQPVFEIEQIKVIDTVRYFVIFQNLEYQEFVSWEKALAQGKSIKILVGEIAGENVYGDTTKHYRVFNRVGYELTTIKDNGWEITNLDSGESNRLHNYNKNHRRLAIGNTANRFYAWQLTSPSGKVYKHNFSDIGANYDLEGIESVVDYLKVVRDFAQYSNMEHFLVAQEKAALLVKVEALKTDKVQLEQEVERLKKMIEEME